MAKERFDSSIADDLNISGALAALFDLSRQANKLADEGRLSASGAKAILDAFRDFDRVTGALNVDAAPTVEAFPPEVEALAQQRADARKRKDFAESDRLRAEIAKLGYTVEDAPGGAYRLKKN